MAKSYLEEFVESNENMRLFQQERAIIDVTELICRVMEEEGITRTMLANKLGKTKGYVTQLLDGEKNKTIRTVADVFAVLGREYYSCERPIQIGQMQDANGHSGLRIYHDPDALLASRTARASQDTTSFNLTMTAGQ